VAGSAAEVEFVVTVVAVGVFVDGVGILLQDSGIAGGASCVVAIAGGANEKIGGVEIVSASRAEDRGREIDLGAELLARSKLNDRFGCVDESEMSGVVDGDLIGLAQIPVGRRQEGVASVEGGEKTRDHLPDRLDGGLWEGLTIEALERGGGMVGVDVDH
jgi:hypothetical protein